MLKNYYKMYLFEKTMHSLVDKIVITSVYIENNKQIFLNGHSFDFLCTYLI